MRRWSLLLVVFALGCGARTELSPPDDAGDADADAREQDGGRDGGPRERCRELERTDGPVQILGGDEHLYVAPQVLARLGGFDVVAFHNDTTVSVSPRHTRLDARRLEVNERGRLTLADPVVLDDPIGAIGRAATDGSTLGVCHPVGADFVLATYEGELYVPRGREVREQPGRRCLALATGGGRWAAAWLASGDAEPATLDVGIFDADGATLAAPVRFERVDSSSADLIALGPGFALSHLASDGAPRVTTFDSGPRRELDVALDVARRVASSRWPYGERSVALISGERLVTVGGASVEATLSTGRETFPHWALATFDHGLVAAAKSFDAAGSDEGLIELTVVKRDGARSPSAASEVFSRGPLSDHRDFDLAAAGEDVVLVWAVEPGRPQATGIWASVFRCAE